MSFLKDVGLPIEPKGFDVRGRRDAGKISKECEEHLLSSKCMHLEMATTAWTI